MHSRSPMPDEDRTPYLVLVHPFDPRGAKVGGIETHVRQLLRKHPPGMRVLLIGTDDSGTLELRKLHAMTIGDASFDFFPILHAPGSDRLGAASRLSQSLTLRFALALAGSISPLRRLLRGKQAVAEIERVEFAPLVRAVGLGFVLISHNEGDPKTDKMDSLLSRFWFLSAFSERLAMRLAGRAFGVTAKICDRLAQRGGKKSPKVELLSVSVDTELFRPSPFDLSGPFGLSGDVLRIVYAGRLDAFKAPATMFRVIEHVAEKLAGQVEFHYCGGGNAAAFPEFAAIAERTVLHGALDSAQVAEVMRSAHIGILVSHYEGMPCFFLELLASGRPFAGVRLPQFDALVHEGISGTMVERAESEDETARAVAVAIIPLWDAIRSGSIDPGIVHEYVLPWSSDQQLKRLFDAHRAVLLSTTASFG